MGVTNHPFSSSRTSNRKGSSVAEVVLILYFARPHTWSLGVEYVLLPVRHGKSKGYQASAGQKLPEVAYQTDLYQTLLTTRKLSQSTCNANTVLRCPSAEIARLECLMLLPWAGRPWPVIGLGYPWTPCHWTIELQNWPMSVRVVYKIKDGP